MADGGGGRGGIYVRGDRIRELRDRAHMTQWDLAQAVGMQPSEVSRLERGGRQNIRAITLGAIAVALETSADYLLGLTDDPEPRGKEAGPPS